MIFKRWIFDTMLSVQVGLSNPSNHRHVRQPSSPCVNQLGNLGLADLGLKDIDHATRRIWNPKQESVCGQKWTTFLRFQLGCQLPWRFRSSPGAWSVKHFWWASAWLWFWWYLGPPTYCQPMVMGVPLVSTHCGAGGAVHWGRSAFWLAGPASGYAGSLPLWGVPGSRRPGRWRWGPVHHNSPCIFLKIFGAKGFTMKVSKAGCSTWNERWQEGLNKMHSHVLISAPTAFLVLWMGQSSSHCQSWHLNLFHMVQGGFLKQGVLFRTGGLSCGWGSPFPRPAAVLNSWVWHLHLLTFCTSQLPCFLIMFWMVENSKMKPHSKTYPKGTSFSISNFSGHTEYLRVNPN